MSTQSNKARESISILGKDVEVVWVETPTDYGAWSQPLLRIILEAGMPQDLAASTMLHEVLEALKDFLKLKLNHDDLERLETGLYAVLKDAGVDMRPLIEEKAR